MTKVNSALLKERIPEIKTRDVLAAALEHANSLLKDPETTIDEAIRQTKDALTAIGWIRPNGERH